MTDASPSEPSRPAAALVPAASVVLLREHAGRVETLLTRRHAGMYFGGMWVFAGGKVDDGDRAAAAAARFMPPAMRYHHAADAWLDAAEARPFLVAAARELAEETGVELERGLDALVHFAHWVTPPGMPRRFDTHFFLATAPADFVVGAASGEVAEFRWVAPRAAVEASLREELNCAPVTAFTLLEVAEALDRHDSLAAMQAGTRGREVLPIVPKVDRGSNPPSTLLPWHARYHEIPGEGTCAAIAISDYYRALPARWTVPASLMPRR